MKEMGGDGVHRFPDPGASSSGAGAGQEDADALGKVLAPMAKAKPRREEEAKNSDDACGDTAKSKKPRTVNSKATAATTAAAPRVPKDVEQYTISSDEEQTPDEEVIAGTSAKTKRNVRRFIERHSLDERSAKKLKEASDDIAEKVVMKGITNG